MLMNPFINPKKDQYHVEMFPSCSASAFRQMTQCLQTQLNRFMTVTTVQFLKQSICLHDKRAYVKAAENLLKGGKFPRFWCEMF